MINVDDRFLSEATQDQFWFMCHVAKYMGKDSKCFPSNQTLCEVTGWKISKLNQVKRSCIEAGMIKVEPRYANNKQRSNIYRIVTDRLSVVMNLKGKEIPATSVAPCHADGTTPATSVAPEVLTIVTNNTMDFEMFWDKYGFKKGSKTNAVKKWEQLTGRDRKDIADTLDLYLRDTVTKDTGRKNGFKPMRKHPEFYLSGRIWEAYVDEAKEQAERDSIPTEYDQPYNAYLKWVQDNTPEVLHKTKHLSKQQFIAFKTTYYVPGKSILGDYLESKYLMDAHRNMSSNPAIMDQYPDAFAYHCAKVEQFVKSQPV